MEDLDKKSEDSSEFISEDTVLEMPPECNVVFYNDDFTPMDFVVDVLMSVFNKEFDVAEDIMMSIHITGSGVAGSYTYDIAVSRANLARNLARKNGYPLRIEVEE
jgi:ATP-dependent Clp protease adaptor protein ClpS